MFETAKTFAQKRADELKQELSSFYESLYKSADSQKAEAEARKQSMLNTINHNITNTQNTYQDNARQAYVNKMQSGNQLGEILSRMNLGQSGFGVGEQMGIESSYGQNLAGLQKSRDAQIGNLNLQALNTESDFNANLLGIDSKMHDNKLSLDQFIHGQTQGAYDDYYKMSVQESQRKADQSASNYRASLAAKAPPKQNIINQSQGLLNWAPGGWNANNVDVKHSGNKVLYIDKITGKQSSFDVGVNPFTGGKPHKDSLTNKVYDPNKSFDNGYQPNNIGGKPLKVAKNKETGEKMLYPFGNGLTQNVWTTDGGETLYVWDGRSNKYQKL